MKKIIFTILLGNLCLSYFHAQTTVFTENFQSGIPGSWTITINDTGIVAPAVSEFAPGWISLADPTNTSDIVGGATSFFTNPATKANRWLITPAITLGAYGNILKWDARSHDPSFPDSYAVLISTTNTQISSFTDTLKLISLENESWTTREINLSDSGYFSQTVHLAFVLRSQNAYKLYLDDISVRIDDPVGIHEFTTSSTVLYPNPVTTTFALKGSQSGRIRIFSTDGQLLHDQSTSAEEQIDVSAFRDGTYIVELHTNRGIERQRFVKI